MNEPPIVDLGSGIFALHDPHPGHERDFNRYYERDHMYAACILAPWTIAGTRFVATADLKRLRYPADGPFGPIQEGSYLTMYWIVAGKLDEQQAWVSDQMKLLNAAGRTFDQRSVQTATSYDYLGSWRRDPDGVPPFQALDRRYSGVVWVAVERTGDESVADLAQWLADDFLPAHFASSPVEVAPMFTPRAKEPWWPAAAPEVPGVGERVFITFFLDGDVRQIWPEHFAGLGDELAATNRCRTLMVAPFIPTVPGTDRYTDQLF
ncbi:MAG: hypothetical protein ABI658_15135 [Acidimicrobiales bacterium]